MDVPTRAKPSISVANGVLTVLRGYECEGGSRVEFVGAHEGPLLKVRGPHASLVMSVAMAEQLRDALTLAIQPPVAPEGRDDEELAAMGFKRIKA